MRRACGAGLSPGDPPPLAEAPPGELPLAPGFQRTELIVDPGTLGLVHHGVAKNLDEIAELGAEIVRLRVNWEWVAPATLPATFDPRDPADPAYQFGWVDDFVREARDRNLKVLIQLAGPAPPWAGENGDIGSPIPAHYNAFAAAFAARYGGSFIPAGESTPVPAIDIWSLWNEPNLDMELTPQFKSGKRWSPLLYRRLFIAGQNGIRGQIPGAAILMGDTAPTGGNTSIDPVWFIRDVLCLSEYAKATAACELGPLAPTGWAAHPYTLLGQAPQDPGPSQAYVTIGNLNALTGVLADAAAAGETEEVLPIYLTEFGYQSLPDPEGVSLETHAEYLALSEMIAASAPTVRTSAQYLIFDDPLSGSNPFLNGFQSGLRFENGNPKPALDALRLPLVVKKDGDRVSVWGMVRPSRGPAKMVLQVQDSMGRVRTLEVFKTGDAGTFQFSSDLAQGRRWRAVWMSDTGPWVASRWTRLSTF